MRYALPQPYRDLGHTADLGIAVEGATAEEALARLVLALGAVLAGGGAVEEEREEVLAAPARGDLARAAVDLLRELVYRFATERLLPCACEPIRADPGGLEARVGLARWDPERHAEGADVKAVTYHAARFAREGDRWRAQVILDV